MIGCQGIDNRSVKPIAMMRASKTMERTRRDIRRTAVLLTTVISMAATFALPQLAGAGSGADEAPSSVILLADTGQGVLRPSAAREKQSETIQSPTPPVSAPLPDSTPVWVPRIRVGAPASRVGGATRARQKAVTIQTLVPEVDEAALTLAAQPKLYWHLSAETSHPVNFTLIDANATDPIVDEMITGPFAAGIQVLSLADYEAQLEPGRNYEWFVAVVHDPENRSADAVARGAIARVADPGLVSQVASSEPDAAAGLLAQSGIWYEALDVVSRRMQEMPEDPRLRQRRDAMLQQVGLALSENR
jgi:hypothetical protein